MKIEYTVELEKITGFGIIYVVCCWEDGQFSRNVAYYRNPRSAEKLCDELTRKENNNE